MKIKNILALLCFLLGLFACTNEDIIEPGGAGKDVEIGKPVTITLSLNTPNAPVVETKAGGEQFGSITSLHALIYDVDKSNELKVVPLTLTGGAASEQTNLKLPTTTGTKKIYVIANWDLKKGSLEERFAAEASLKTWSPTAAKISTEEPTSSPMLGFVDTDYGASVVAYEAGTVSELVIDVDKMYKKQGNDLVALNGNIQASVIPSYSKISFEVVNNIHTDMDKKVQLEISNVYVRNLPKKYSLYPFPEKTLGTDDVDPGRTKIMEGASSCEFYMYENLQGDSKNNENAAWKSPFADKGPASSGDMNLSYEKWNKYWAGETACTYIEVEGKYSIWKSATVMGSGDIHYRFFLGGDAVKNFDVKRNTHYKVQLVFSGIGGYDELKYEWRVNAQLNDVTIIPEGQIEIDGSPDYYFPFVIINGSDNTFTVTVDNRGECNMNIQYYSNEYKGWYSSGDDISKNLPAARKYTEYKIQANAMGILGMAGMTFVDNDGSIYGPKSGADKFEANDVNRDKIRRGDIYVKRTYTVNVNPAFDFIVKMYPLLCLKEKHYKDSGDNETVYAQRFDRSEGYVTYEKAKDICKYESASNELYTFLPRVEDLSLMIQLETYEPFKPKSEGPYWTKDGLYKWAATGPVQVSGDTGLVRCVYSNYKGRDDRPY